MTIKLKNDKQIAQMRVAGQLAAEVLAMIREYVVPGVSTEELDRRCHDYIRRVQKATPANVGYHGFPKTLCTSVNGVVCHGIPKEQEVLKDGDIVNIASTSGTWAATRLRSPPVRRSTTPWSMSARPSCWAASISTRPTTRPRPGATPSRPGGWSTRPPGPIWTGPSTTSCPAG